jgi:hypothetical protein
MLYKDYAGGDIESAVEKVLSLNVGSSQAVKHILINQKNRSDLSFSTLDDWQTLPPPDVSIYGQIGGVI